MAVYQDALTERCVLIWNNKKGFVTLSHGYLPGRFSVAYILRIFVVYYGLNAD